MKNQEIFDKVATHLFTQGVMSHSDAMDDCLYRGPNGTMCAVGCLIPDDKYTYDMEHKSVFYLGKVYPELFHKRNIPLLDALQNIHDDRVSWFSTDRMKAKLKSVAKRFRLKATVLETLSFNGR